MASPKKRSTAQDRAARKRMKEFERASKKTAQVLYSLECMAATGARALIVSEGSALKRLVRIAHESGVGTIVPYVEDNPQRAELAGADASVSCGNRELEGMWVNARVVLHAAIDAQADIILLGCGSQTLAENKEFFGMAAAVGMVVYKEFTAGKPEAGWLLCEAEEALEEPEWVECKGCGLSQSQRILAQTHKICPNCGYYLRMRPAERIDELLDKGSFVPWDENLPQPDPLDFPGYKEKLEQNKVRSGAEEAVVSGYGEISGLPVAVGFMDSTFFMASMGSVVGERICRLIERATRHNLPVVMFCASGGARMQEGLVSLMQMAKISAALERHGAAGLLYVSVITDPTTGGVTASFATEGDLIISEPHALLGFAGRRVIQDTIRQELPPEFQTAEFALEHGLIDAIVERDQLRACLTNVLALHIVTAKKLPTVPELGEGFEPSVKGGPSCSAADGMNMNEPPTSFAPGNALRLLFGGAKNVPDNETTAAGRQEATRAFNAKVKERVLQYVPRVLTPRLPKRDEERSRDELKEERKLARALAAEEAAATKRAARREYALAKSAGPTALREFRTREAQRQRGTAVVVQSAEAGSAWESVQLARNTHRPTARYYIDSMVDGFLELHGDRFFADDGAIVAGIGWIGSQPVTILAEEKGLDLKDRINRRFGSPQPEGYRKTLRLMRQAEKFGRPVVCIVDTQGAYCGAEAEERGIGNAIAENLRELAGLRVPVIAVLVGEGGSGGALALALADKVAMLEHAVYSVLSPEGFASILWRDRSRAPEAAAAMRMSAAEIHEMDIVEAVLDEGPVGAHETPAIAAASVREFVETTLNELTNVPIDELLEARYQRYRGM